MNISRISCEKAYELTQTNSCQIVDIRDPQSFQSGHPVGAIALDNNSLPTFLETADKQAATLVFCYHGNSSQQATLFLQEQGFTNAHSIDGGFEMWRQLYPDAIES